MLKKITAAVLSVLCIFALVSCTTESNVSEEHVSSEEAVSSESKTESEAEYVPETKSDENEPDETYKVDFAADSGTLTISGEGTVYGKGIVRSVTDARIDPALVKAVRIEGFDTVGSFKLPEKFENYDLTVAGSVKTIGEMAFSYAAMKSFKAEAGLTDIKDYAFCGCDNAKSFSLPSGITHIGTDILVATSYKKDGTKWQVAILYLGNYALCSRNCLANYFLENGTVLLADKVFYEHEHLRNLTVPASVKIIGSECFAGCPDIRNLVLPDGVQVKSNVLDNSKKTLADYPNVTVVD